MVAALIDRPASAPCATNAASWSIARKIYDGPADTGRDATRAPIAGPDRSVMIEAVMTNAAATAMRSASESRKARSGDILLLRHGGSAMTERRPIRRVAASPRPVGRS